MSDYADNLRRSMINKTRRFMRMVQEMQEKDDAALREQVIRMARKAGFANVRGGLMDNGEISDYWDCWPGQLERFFLLAAAAGAEAEREACAKVCDEIAQRDETGYGIAEDCASAIRAMGSKE